MSIFTLAFESGEEFPGVLFLLSAADIVSQILNFGLPRPDRHPDCRRDVRRESPVANTLMQQLSSVTGIADCASSSPSTSPNCTSM